MCERVGKPTQENFTKNKFGGKGDTAVDDDKLELLPNSISETFSVKPDIDWKPRITTSAQEEMQAMVDEINDVKEKRRDWLQKKAIADTPNLADMDQYENLSPKDKMAYMYNVRTQFSAIQKMISVGIPEVKIAEALDISYAALKRMKENIPEVGELFHLGKLAKVQSAEESLYRLTQDRVVEKQELDRAGNIVTMQEVKPADFRAIKMVLETHDKEYAKKQVVEHTATMTPELEMMLKSLSTEELSRALNAAEAIDITDEVEISE